MTAVAYMRPLSQGDLEVANPPYVWSSILDVDDVDLHAEGE